MDSSLWWLYVLFGVIVLVGLAVSFGAWYLFSRVANGGGPVFGRRKKADDFSV